MDGNVTPDLWAQWLWHHRDGQNPARAAAVQADVLRQADRVIDAAALEPGMCLVDVGAGDGLVALRALARLGALRVILADVSAPLLHAADAAARAAGVQAQCSFVRCDARDLVGVADGCADALTTRSAFAYVSHKAAALLAFHRVLKPGGRISLAEPVFRDAALEVAALKLMTQRAGATEGGFAALLHRWKATQFPDSEAQIEANPLTNHSERDLFRMAQAAGFEQVHLELHLDMCVSEPMDWEIFLELSPHPLASPLGVVLAHRFNAAERAEFERVLRPQIEAGGQPSTGRMVYLTARKPAG